MIDAEISKMSAAQYAFGMDFVGQMPTIPARFCPNHGKNEIRLTTADEHSTRVAGLVIEKHLRVVPQKSKPTFDSKVAKPFT